MEKIFSIEDMKQANGEAALIRKAYNEETGSKENKLNEELITNAMTDGELFDALIKGQEVTYKDPETGEEKKINYENEGINSKISAARVTISNLTEQQEAIKRETAGSGIGEGKK